LEYPLTNEALQTIDGLPAKEAIVHHWMKNAPYPIRGHHSVPMTVAEAEASYKATGLASWYREEARRADGGSMTANGKLFNPEH
jgi:rare lipoprotein A (peptidoglycan hydrolase)